MRKLEVSNTEVLLSVIKNTLTSNQQSRFLHRLHCVLLVGQGFSCYQVAEWFEEHPRTLERWVHNYGEYGAESLKDEPKTGRPKKVGDNQLKKLKNDLFQSPHVFGYRSDVWDGKLLQDHLRSNYVIELSIRHCQRLITQFSNSSK